MSAQDGHHDDVAVDVFTSAGLFQGNLRVPKGTTVLEHLNRAGEHLRLADAHVEGDPMRIAFLALRRDNVRVVVPRDEHAETALAPRAAEGPFADIAGVMDGYRLRGKVRLAPGQRATDFFASAPAFVAVRECNVWRASDLHAKPTHATVALIRAHALVAFSDTLD